MISVIIPTYNREKTIKRCIDSVLNQTVRDLEVIVVDDGSIDSTLEIVKRIPDNRIIYTHQSNSGACSARNAGISLSKGEYIAFQDSDDEWIPNKLAIYLQLIEEKNCDFICGTLMDRQGATINSCKMNAKGKFLTDRDSARGYSTQTFFGKREVFEAVRFDEKVPRLQDFDFLTRVIGKYSVFFYERPLVYYYLQKDSLTNSLNKFRDAVNYFFEKYREDKRKKIIYKDLSNFYAYMIIERQSIDHPAPLFYLKRFVICNHSLKGLLKALYLFFLCVKGNGSSGSPERHSDNGVTK